MHPAKCSGIKSCESGDVILSICDRANVRPCDFMGGRVSR